MYSIQSAVGIKGAIHTEHVLSQGHCIRLKVRPVTSPSVDNMFPVQLNDELEENEPAYLKGGRHYQPARSAALGNVFIQLTLPYNCQVVLWYSYPCTEETQCTYSFSDVDEEFNATLVSEEDMAMKVDHTTSPPSLPWKYRTVYYTNHDIHPTYPKNHQIHVLAHDDYDYEEDHPFG